MDFVEKAIQTKRSKITPQRKHLTTDTFPLLYELVTFRPFGRASERVTGIIIGRVIDKRIPCINLKIRANGKLYQKKVTDPDISLQNDIPNFANLVRLRLEEAKMQGFDYEQMLRKRISDSKFELSMLQSVEIEMERERLSKADELW